MSSAAAGEADVAGLAVQGLQAGLGDRLVATVLYGSRARGDAKPHSDWDLFVIAEDLPDHPVDRAKYLHKMLPAGGVALFARTPKEFEGYLPALYLDIGLDGVILYDRDGYAAGRLATLRQLIETAGLFRVRRPNGDSWQWRNPPAGRWAIEWDGVTGVPVAT